MTSSDPAAGLRVGDVLLASFKGRWRQLAGVIAWSLVEAVPGFLSGRLVATAVDHGFLVHRPLTGLAWLSLLGLAVFIGGWAARQVYLHLASLVEPFRDLLAALTVSSALRRSTAPRGRADTSAVARLTRQVEIAREAYASLMAVVLGFGVATVSALIGLASLEPVALAFVLPPLVVGLGIFVGSLKRLTARQEDSILADESLSEATTQLMDARRDVVASGGEPIVQRQISQHILAQATATRSLAGLTATRNLAVSVGGLLPVLLVLFASPWLVRHGATPGIVLGVLTYLLSGVHPALQTLVRGLGPSGAWLLVSVRRLLQASDSADLRNAVEASKRESLGPEMPSAGAPVRATRVNRQPCDLALCDVTFTYGAAPEPVIRDFDLSVRDGDHLAIVGSSGIGKSTLAALMSGLLHPQSGQVVLAGKPVERLSRHALARARVLVPEEAYVFSGSLLDNVRYLRPSTPIRQVEAAVDLLGAGSVIERLGGLDAQLDPSMLSAGERQLIAVLRAYLSPSRLVILDEATCHLDATSEARVERAFADRAGTLIVVAHRMSSALRARRILVLDGKAALFGTHKRLLGASEFYRDLVGCWLPSANGNGHIRKDPADGRVRRMNGQGRQANGHPVSSANGRTVTSRNGNGRAAGTLRAGEGQ